MNNVALALMLCLGMSACAVEQEELSDETALNEEAGALTKGDSGDPTTKFLRTQCYAQTASLRDSPGGNVIGQVYNGQTVDVQAQSGAWFFVYHYASATYGWTLAQYYC